MTSADGRPPLGHLEATGLALAGEAELHPRLARPQGAVADGRAGDRGKRSRAVGIERLLLVDLEGLGVPGAVAVQRGRVRLRPGGGDPGLLAPEPASLLLER